MNGIAWVAFEHAVGLTVFGLAGSLVEIACGQRLTLNEPLVSRTRPLRSLGLTSLAGPFMLANDAVEARRQGRIGRPVLFACLAIAASWSFAAGVLVVALAMRATGLVV